MLLTRLLRLLHYARRYTLYLLGSVVLMAIVGLLDAFRVLLIGPILSRVLDPVPQTASIPLFQLPFSHRPISLDWFVPAGIRNDWSRGAYAFVGATLIKGISDYIGTYMVNYAGFGMITDLRNALYNAILRRSVGFFHRHSTGTLLSTIINDVEKVQFA